MDIRVGILTISDSCSKGIKEDTSGNTIEKIVRFESFKIIYRDTLPDDRSLISRKLAEWGDSGKLDLILTTGGTGLSPRDVTPEATMSVIDNEVPGIVDVIRVRTSINTPTSMLSRSVCGTRSGCLIINLPGSTTAVKEYLAVAIPVIPHAIQMISGSTDH